MRASSIPIALALLFAPAAAAGPPAAADRDPALEVRARAALAADPELAGLPLMVSVVDRIAVVGGPVPGADLIDRIEAAVRRATGLSDVRVTCWVPATDDPLRRMVGDRLKGAGSLPVPPLALAPRPDPTPSPAPLLALAPRPAEERTAADTVTVQRITAPPALAGVLLDPVAPGGVLPMPSPAGSYPTIPSPAVPAAPVSGPGAVPAVLAALKQDPRFAGLTVELRSGAAVIGGRAGRHADAWEFASAVRKLPGVERVIVGDVDVP
jgi:hypothetical protein